MRGGAIAILILAAMLRTMRAACRWDEWALHYAAYYLPGYEALQTGAYVELLTTWVGLHPPLFTVIHSGISMVWSAPAAWMLFSATCSLLAVIFLLAAHPNNRLPALLLATDPVQLHYAAEVNNYPLSVLLISIAWWGLRTNRTWAIAVAGTLGVWTHVMAGLAIVAIGVSHRNRVKLLAPILLSAIPLLGTGWLLASDAGSQRQPPLLLELSMRDAIERFSIGWVMLFPILLLGLVRDVAAAIGWAACVGFWVFTIALGIAAPHQFPYAMILGVFAAALLGAATHQRPVLAGLVLLAALTRGAWFGLSDGYRLHTIYTNLEVHRGIDAVWELSLPGDAIVLVRGPGAPDDDRRKFSPTLWRISPFEPSTPLSTGIRPDLAGQPRMIRGRRLYTFEHPREAIGTIPGAHVFTVLYDGAEHNRAVVPDHPRQGEWVVAGPDLWRGPTFTPSSPEEADEPQDEAIDALRPGQPASG